MTSLSKSSRIISDETQGTMSKEKYTSNSDDILLQIYVYYDEIECGNDSGTHSGKNEFGAIYASIGCLAPRLASKIDSIFLYSLMNSEDKKYTTNEKIFVGLLL